MSLVSLPNVFAVSTSYVVSPVSNKIDLWHARLGHVPQAILKPLNFTCNSQSLSHCDICHLSKQTRTPFLSSTTVSLSKFDLIHCDVWGPYKHKTYNNCFYFLTIVDDFSRCTWIYLFHSKHQVSSILINFITHVRTQFNCTIKAFGLDNGTKFHTLS